MDYKKFVVTVFALWDTVNTVYAQKVSDNTKIILSGKVCDLESHEPVPYSHIFINEMKGVAADGEAEFLFAISMEDTLRVSCLGYNDARVIMSEMEHSDSLFVEILLEKKIHELDEVVVSPYRSYAQKKQAFLNLKLENKEHEIAMKNIKTAKRQAKSGIVPYDPLDSPDFKPRDRMVPGVAILSTDPNRGILSVFK
jgi:hypothetical protein